MENTIEALIAENNALKETIQIQAATIQRLINAYVLKENPKKKKNKGNE